MRLAPACSLLVTAALLSIAGCGKPAAAPAPTDKGARAAADAGVATRRLVLGPNEVAVIDASGVLRPGQLPVTVVLGREGAAAAAVLLRFDIPRDVEVLEAFLVVDLADDGGPDGRGVGLRTERIAGPWAAGAVTWGGGPPLDAPSTPLVIPPGGRRHLRLDVGFLRGDHRAGGPDDGIALVAERAASGGVSVTVAAHTSGELAPRAPRLELYVK